MQILSKPPKSKVNHFFSQQLKQSYNYQAESIVQKKNFLEIDTRFKKQSPPAQQQMPRATSTKIEFYQQQLRQMDHINQNFIEKLATSEIELKQYHFDVIRLNQQINNLERHNAEICEKYDMLVKESRDNEKYITDLDEKLKGIQEIITKLYNTISSNENSSTYKDLEYIFNTDSTVEKQLETICYVMLQCCRENNLLRKTLAEQDQIIVKLNQRTNHANIQSNIQLQATSKLLSDFEAFSGTVTFDETESKHRHSPFKTPFKSQYNTFDKPNNRDSRRTKGTSNRCHEERNWERDRLKNQLSSIDGEIERLQARITQEMRY